MINSAAYLRVYDHSLPLRGPVIAAVVIGCALIAAGCGASSSSGSAGPAGDSGPAAASQTPDQALVAAAARSSKITSMAGDLTVNVGGEVDISAAVEEQIKPTLGLSMNLKLSAGGSSEALGVVINGVAIWEKDAAVQRHTGKLWLKIPLSVLDKSNSSAVAVFKTLQNLNPAQQTAWLAGFQNAREDGTQTINGVPTTEYSGSIVPSRAAAKMTPALRKALASGLKTISGDMQFSVWIDGSDQVRKQVLREIAGGRQITTTILFTAINQPVHVALPPASQTATLP